MYQVSYFLVTSILRLCDLLSSLSAYMLYINRLFYSTRVVSNHDFPIVHYSSCFTVVSSYCTHGTNNLARKWMWWSPQPQIEVVDKHKRNNDELPKLLDGNVCMYEIKYVLILFVVYHYLNLMTKCQILAHCNLIINFIN